MDVQRSIPACKSQLCAKIISFLALYLRAPCSAATHPWLERDLEQLSLKNHEPPRDELIKKNATSEWTMTRKQNCVSI